VLGVDHASRVNGRQLVTGDEEYSSGARLIPPSRNTVRRGAARGRRLKGHERRGRLPFCCRRVHRDVGEKSDSGLLTSRRVPGLSIGYLILSGTYHGVTVARGSRRTEDSSWARIFAGVGGGIVHLISLIFGCVQGQTRSRGGVGEERTG